MSIQVRRVLTLVLTLATLTLLAACGPSNNVRLIYNTNTNAVLPLPGSPSVAVVMFNDERTRQYIGERKDGSVFTASSTIADWFSRSLADELGRQGVQVSFAPTLEQARAAKPDYIVTGDITDVWMQELSATRVQCTIKAKIALSNKKGVVYSENLSSRPGFEIFSLLLLSSSAEPRRPPKSGLIPLFGAGMLPHSERDHTAAHRGGHMVSVLCTDSFFCTR